MSSWKTKRGLVNEKSYTETVHEAVILLNELLAELLLKEVKRMATIDDFELGGRYLITVKGYWRSKIIEVRVIEKAKRFVKMGFLEGGCDTIYNNLSYGEWFKDGDIEILERLSFSSSLNSAKVWKGGE